MKKLISFILCIAFTLTLCSCGRGLKRFEKSFFDCFDTVSNVVVYDESEKAFEEKYALFHEKADYYSRLFDIYKYDDELVSLKYVNDHAAEAPVKVEKEIIELLKYGKEVYDISGGTVNICMGSVLKIWHEYREEGTRVPETSLLEAANKHTDINALVINETDCTVYFSDSDLSLDVGAIAKGYAAKELTEYAKSELWSSALINLGGNVSTYGMKPDGSKWNVQLENPDENSSEPIKTLSVTDKAVVTSGNYQRYYEVDGKRYCHIIDPKTLMPADEFASVSVICDDSALADALSTALFIMPLDEGRKLINSLGNAEAVWVDKNYNIIE
ncbi:MAG: FAD:protein FMN transferase [Eubacterium sp.]|nr:FAD:protein FMN transferase [Eubacterium sp.]